MTTRYATIIEGDNGEEIVSNIGQFEGGPPNIRAGKAEQVADGVLIGMVRTALSTLSTALASRKALRTRR